MRRLIIILCCLASCSIEAQELFSLSLVETNSVNMPGVHSGAYVTYNNKWVFIGGRKNGLHGFLTPSAFPENGVNDSIYVVDPVANQNWRASAYDLPDSIREAVTSSNMEFYLNDSMLYMVGGYGWNEDVQDFITFPKLTAVNISGLISAVINAQPIAGFFRQVKDTSMSICGAHLAKMDSTYYLVFGHRYDGHYDRTDTVSVIAYQAYSYEIRKFQIADNGSNLSIYNYSALRDSTNFRRRDYNLIPFLDPYRGEGLLAFSGVFQPHITMPYFTPIEIFPDTVIVRNDFNQNLSQYHSGVCAIYDSINFLQHNIFFGGLSVYYMDTLTHLTVTDSLVPFVRTISDVARDIDLTYHEFDAGIKMPALLGTNAYFMKDLNVATYKNHFIHLNALPVHQRIGYIVGGIESMDLNIADNNPNAQSFASTRVFEVYIDKADTITRMSAVNNDVLNFFCYPNPARNRATVEFELKQTEQVKLTLSDMQGRLVKEICNKQIPAGKQKLLLDISDYPKGVYNCTLSISRHSKTIRLAKE